MTGTEQPMLEALERVIYICQAAVTEGHQPAIVVFEPDVPPTAYMEYWSDPAKALAFERAVAARAANAGWSFGAFAVPLVMVDTDTGTAFRQPTPDLPLREGEESVIWGLAFDVNLGYQVARCRVDYDAQAQPVFDDIEGLMGEITLTEAPGNTLFQSMLEG